MRGEEEQSALNFSLTTHHSPLITSSSGAARQVGRFAEPPTFSCVISTAIILAAYRMTSIGLLGRVWKGELAQLV